MNIYKKAILKFGQTNQIWKIQEECLELCLAISNMNCETKDKIVPKENFIREVSDVCIMMKQAELIIGKHILEAQIHNNLQKLQKHLKT
jgi:hypothetical protein